MEKEKEKVIWQAEFNPKVTTYWLLSGCLVLTATVVGIPLLPIWFLVGTALTRRYLASYQCTLTSRTLKLRKGVFVKQEKTVPLDRITDLGLVQGPIMRMLDLEALSVETAGQSTPGSLISLTGIKQGRAFRDAVLNQRDRVVGSEEERRTAPPLDPATHSWTGGTAETTTPLLRDIADTLKRIETQLRDRQTESPTPADPAVRSQEQPSSPTNSL